MKSYEKLFSMKEFTTKQNFENYEQYVFIYLLSPEYN